MRPFPVNTNARPLDSTQLIAGKTEAVLDLGRGDNLVTGFQLLFQTLNYIHFMALTCLVVALGYCIHWGGGYGWAVLIFFIMVLSAYLLLGGGFFYGLFQEKRDLPLRVNRQRREVALPVKVTRKKQAYVQVPWEELVVWVRSKTRVAATGVTGSVELTLAKENKTTPGTYDATVTYYPGSMAQALGLWESIRAFMEKGPEHCPPSFEERLKGKVSFSSPTLAGYKALLKESKDQYNLNSSHKCITQ